jgi:gluconokinase
MSTGPAAAYPPAEVIIGLDVGTTAAKVAAFGLGSSWRHTAIREYPLLQPRPGWQVQDPPTIDAAVQAALGECVAAIGGATVVALSASTAMHGLIGLDARLQPLTPLITWADARSRDQAAELRATGVAREVYRITGTPIHPMTPLTKLMWFTRHEPELSAHVRWWVGLKDYILLSLTGTLATELSSASGTAMFDVHTREWSRTSIHLAGISADQLPPVLATTSALGLAKAVAHRVGLPAGLPVIAGAADGPLGNLGTSAMAPGVVGLSIGTSGAARMVVPEPTLDPDGRLFCYALTDEHWVVGGAVSNGGIVARWAGDVFGHGLGESAGPRAPDVELLTLAESIPAGSDGLVMIPYLLAERAPLWNPDLTGAFLGIQYAHTRGHFIRAAVEGVALQLAAVVDGLDRIEPVTAIRATGGVFRSRLWRDVVAGTLARPVQVTGGAEGTALGAAALGLYALGRVYDLSLATSLLTAADEGTAAPTVPITLPADLEAYARLRSAVPMLIAACDEVAGLFDVTRRANS